MLLNAGSLVSRIGGHGGIYSFGRAIESIVNLAAALVCSMTPISQQRSLIYMRVIILPDSIVVGVVTCLLSEGSFSREKLEIERGVR